MSEQQMIAYLPATTAEQEKAIAAFEAVNPTLFKEKGSLNEMVSEGWCDAITVTFDNQPALVLFVSISPDGGLWVHAVQALQNCALALAFVACEAIQKDRNLKYIRFTTCRKGMVESALVRGYTVDGVLMSKH